MTWNNNVRRQVLTLYRAKLRITREMGYKPLNLRSQTPH